MSTKCVRKKIHKININEKNETVCDVVSLIEKENNTEIKERECYK